MIGTRHNLHGKLVIESLKAGKHVYTEKPLCIKKEELDAIQETYTSLLTPNSSLLPILMVGSVMTYKLLLYL